MFNSFSARRTWESSTVAAVAAASARRSRSPVGDACRSYVCALASSAGRSISYRDGLTRNWDATPRHHDTYTAAWVVRRVACPALDEHRDADERCIHFWGTSTGNQMLWGNIPRNSISSTMTVTRTVSRACWQTRAGRVPHRW